MYLIKDKENEKAKKILEENNDILSYFIKFKHESKDGIAMGKVILLSIGGWHIMYDGYYENEIKEDLSKLKKEIEKKENRLEQYRFLKQQNEFINLQKQDIEENKKDRKRIQNFTFVLAVGVLISAIYYLFQIAVEFKKTNSLHVMILSGIFIIFLVLLISFIFSNFKMGKEISLFFKEQWFPIIIHVAIIFLFFCLLLISPDKQINNDIDANIKTVAPDDFNDTNGLNTSSLDGNEININKILNPKYNFSKDTPIKNS